MFNTESIQQLKDAAFKTVLKVHDGKYDRIIFSGGSSVIARQIFLNAWDKLFTNEPLPAILSFDSEANRHIYKIMKDVTPEDRQQYIFEYLEKQGISAEKLGTEKLAYIEEFALSGEKYGYIKKFFTDIGLHNIDYHFFATKNADNIEGAWVATENPELTGRLVRLSENLRGSTFEPQEMGKIPREVIMERAKFDLSNITKAILE